MISIRFATGDYGVNIKLCGKHTPVMVTSNHRSTNHCVFLIMTGHVRPDDQGGCSVSDFSI